MSIISEPTDISIEMQHILDEEASRINTPDFILNDPVQFPRRFNSLADIEIVALLISTIAWGNRKMICRDCEKLLALMDYQPHHYLMDKGYEELPQMNIHRTFFSENLRHYLRGLYRIYSEFASLHDYVTSRSIHLKEEPSWALAESLGIEIASANGGCYDARCLPVNCRTTALKRLNMALRWLVRDDGIVDMGVWKAITPAQLYIPLDVHVANTARRFGLLSRKSNDRQAVLSLTSLLRTIRPEDPVFYDFALFGLGIEKSPIVTEL